MERNFANKIIEMSRYSFEALDQTDLGRCGQDLRFVCQTPVKSMRRRSFWLPWKVGKRAVDWQRGFGGDDRDRRLKALCRILAR